MNIRTLVASATLGVFGFVLLSNSADNTVVSVWVSCEGTVVTRTSVGKLELSRVEQNSPRCQGPKVSTGSLTNTAPVHTGSLTLSGSTGSTVLEGNVGPRNTILLDLKQVDTVNYRLEIMRQNQIRYANAIRSVRMRKEASKGSKTNAYLIKNDAVMLDGAQSGWSSVQGVALDVVDTTENTIAADTTGKAKGYVATKYLREANPSDLVRIRQADNAYWSDVAHVNAERYLNVRSHPWFTAPIVTTLGRDTVLYVVSTVDDWSEVITDDRSIQGYVKSKYLTIDKAQRVEQEPLLK